MLQEPKISKMPVDQKRIQIKKMNDNYLIAILDRLREWSQSNTIG